MIVPSSFILRPSESIFIRRDACPLHRRDGLPYQLSCRILHLEWIVGVKECRVSFYGLRKVDTDPLEINGQKWRKFLFAFPFLSRKNNISTITHRCVLFEISFFACLICDAPLFWLIFAYSLLKKKTNRFYVFKKGKTSLRKLFAFYREISYFHLSSFKQKYRLHILW